MDLSFYSLSSGSSGNCYYLGNGFHGILIDAGIPAGSIRRFLKYLGIPLETIMGVLITHNHIDHIRGLEVLLKKNTIPVFTSRKVWRSILKLQYKISPDCIKEISLRQKFHLAGFDIEAFPVNHDSPETLGFHISAGGKKITIATDLGHICDTAAQYLKAADILVIESNYDESLLVNGSYPWFLKSRIKSDHGHLGNHQTSSFLADIINDTPKKICLAHLSKNNNTPETALSTLWQTFSERGISDNIPTEIIVLKRSSPTVILEPDDHRKTGLSDINHIDQTGIR